MIPKEYSPVLTIHGVRVQALVPPYLWMYPQADRKLMVYVSMLDEGGNPLRGSDPHLESEVRYSDAAESDVIALVNSISFGRCEKCGHPTWAAHPAQRNAAPEFNPCPRCADKALREVFARMRADAKRRARTADAKAYAKGMRWKAEGWIHPKSGSDLQFRIESPDPISDAYVKQFLRTKRSEVLDDYRILPIEKPADSDADRGAQ